MRRDIRWTALPTEVCPCLLQVSPPHPAVKICHSTHVKLARQPVLLQFDWYRRRCGWEEAHWHWFLGLQVMSRGSICKALVWWIISITKIKHLNEMQLGSFHMDWPVTLLYQKFKGPVIFTSPCFLKAKLHLCCLLMLSFMVFNVITSYFPICSATARSHVQYCSMACILGFVPVFCSSLCLMCQFCMCQCCRLKKENLLMPNATIEIWRCSRN